MEHLRKVFQVLWENELCIKRKNCEFTQSKVHFLGHVISNGELCMDEAKFISGYSAKAAPLTELLKKNKPWVWTEHCQKAFESLNAAVTEGPVLALPEFAKTFEARWQDFLAEFDYVLEYKPDKGNVIADTLSWKAELLAITSTR
uniref:Uncharacterized mitochondrial protein AtMg00860-like n=1 Tax=Nicotiana tabacum TaxID=4097 RepID=A0A1S4B0W4_TOBAC|nr:PREDICTED: uncharacterized mitochondrial protein AtMg00860-like [Nicotiana tabacum]